MIATQKVAIANFNNECGSSEEALYERVMAKMGGLLREELDSLKGCRAVEVDKVRT